MFYAKRKITNRKSQIANRNRPPSSKIEIWNSKLFSPPCFHSQFVNINESLRIIYLVLTGFNLSNQSAQKTSSITMDTDDIHGERESIVLGILVIIIIVVFITVLVLVVLIVFIVFEWSTITSLQSSQYIIVFKTVCITIIVAIAIAIVDIVIFFVIDINFIFLIIISVLEFNSILTIMKW